MLRKMIKLDDKRFQEPRIKHLLTVLLRPLEYLHRLFIQFKDKIQNHWKYSGQVFSLQKAIIEYCDNDRCYITDGEYIEETFVPYDGIGNLSSYQLDVPYNDEAGYTNKYLHTGTSQIIQNDFIVHLPSEMYGNIDESELRTLIDEYKIAGKKYSIVYDGVTTDTLDHLWIDPICVQQVILEDAYNFQWGEPVCIQRDVTWRFGWQEPICIQKNDILF